LSDEESRRCILKTKQLICPVEVVAQLDALPTSLMPNGRTGQGRFLSIDQLCLERTRRGKRR